MPKPETNLPRQPSLRQRLAALRVVLRTQFAAVRNWFPARITTRHVQLLVGLGLLLVLVQVFAGWLTERRPKTANPADELKLAAVLTQLDAGETSEARKMAAQLRAKHDLPYEDQGGPAFVFGVIAAAEAEAASDPRQQLRSYLIAARYLEESQVLGFPPEREGQGLYLLGRALFFSRKYVRAQQELKAALEQAPEHRAEILLLLARAHGWESNPNLKLAAHYAGEFLAEPALPLEQQRAGLREQCEIALRAGDEAQALAALEALERGPNKSFEVLILRARWLLGQGATAAAAGTNSNSAPAALAAAREIQALAAPASEAARQAACLLGLAYAQQGDTAAAQAQLERVRRVHYETPEALVAGLTLADLKRGQGDHVAALALFEACVREAGQPQRFSHPWLTLEQLRGRLVQAFEDYRQAGLYGEALGLARVLPPVVAEDRSLQFQSEIHRAWAERLAHEAAELSELKSRPVWAEARQQWREAGRTRGELAKLRYATREYPELVWTAGENYLHGQDFGAAVRYFQRYLREEPRRRRPTTLVNLGEALAGLSREEEALPLFRECTEFYPQDPASHRARLLEARALAGQGDLSQAKKRLLENLKSDAITPASMEWRETLFLLGKLVFEEGVALETKSRVAGVDSSDADQVRAALKVLEESHAAHLEAIERLQEAVERYPQAPQAIEARYLLAEAHRISAKLPRKKLPTVTIETIRVNLNREMQHSLQAAVTLHVGLQHTLGEKQELTELSQQEQEILRNAYFGHADALFDLGQYEDAIRAYANATNRYQRDPAALEAYMQIAACYRRLNRPVEAKGTLEQAKVVLTRLRQETNFLETTRYGRDDWTQFLAWMSSL